MKDFNKSLNWQSESEGNFQRFFGVSKVGHRLSPVQGVLPKSKNAILEGEPNSIFLLGQYEVVDKHRYGIPVEVV